MSHHAKGGSRKVRDLRLEQQLRDYRELKGYRIERSPGALAIEPEELAGMIRDHLEEARTMGVIRISVFEIDYLRDKRLVVVSTAKDPTIVVSTVEDLPLATHRRFVR